MQASFSKIIMYRQHQKFDEENKPPPSSTISAGFLTNSSAASLSAVADFLSQSSTYNVALLLKLFNEPSLV
jgi:hypothetical protein